MRRPTTRRPPTRTANNRPGIGGIPGQNPGARPGANNAARAYEIEIPLHEEAKVRTNQLPVVFDGKGRIKEYTPEELQAFKGETPAEKKLTGYKSSLNELRAGDTLQVLLGTPKGKASAGEKVALGPGGELTGVLTRVGSNVVTLRVTGVPPQGITAEKGAKGTPKFVLKPEQKQASLVVVKERGAPPTIKGKPKK